jgi:glycosyltransferase involved in cell wall biosynthesis
MQIHLLTPLICREGGADVYTEMLAAGLSERGHDVSLICQRASDSVRRRWRTAVVNLPDYDQWRGCWRAAPYLRWRCWQQFIASLGLPQPDVLISSKGFCSAALVKRFPGVPLIYLPHSRIEPLEIDQMLHVADLRDYYRLPDRVRFDVIPAGIDGPANGPEKTPSSAVRLLSICRLVESKNLHFLIDALSSITHCSWRLDIVGDGPERSRLQELVNTRGLRERVHFRGHQRDPDRFYTQTDLHVFPSRLESLGLVVLEAMAHGVPTLAIQADGDCYRNANHELIQHDVDGLLARDEGDFSRLLKSCIVDPNTLRTLGEAARQTYVARHRWPVVIDRWESLLSELVPGRAIGATADRRRGNAAAPEYALVKS